MKAEKGLRSKRENPTQIKDTPVITTSLPISPFFLLFVTPRTLSGVCPVKQREETHDLRTCSKKTLANPSETHIPLYFLMDGDKDLHMMI